MANTKQIRNPHRTLNMTTQLPPCDRFEFEKEIHELFENGDLSNIARYLHKDQGQTSREFNPHDAAHPGIEHRFLLNLWAMDCLRDGLADTVLNIIIREREKWLVDGVIQPARSARLTRNVGTELMEAVEAELDDAPLDVQINEWTDVITAASKKKKAAIERRGMQFNGNGRNGR